MPCSRSSCDGGWYPSANCLALFPVPQPRGKLRGTWSRPTAKGEVEGPTLSRPTAKREIEGDLVQVPQPRGMLRGICQMKESAHGGACSNGLPALGEGFYALEGISGETPPPVMATALQGTAYLYWNAFLLYYKFNIL